MLNLRIGGIVAGAAFVFSCILGLVGRTAMPLLLIRAAIFAVIFFVISALVKMVAGRFLPELLEDDGSGGDEVSIPGSRINIMEGDSLSLEGGAADTGSASLAALADDSEEGLGNIADLLRISKAPRVSNGETQAGMDQNPQDDYTKEGETDKFSTLIPDEGSVPAFSSSGAEADEAEFGGSSASDGILPDLDSMAGAFMSSAAGGEPDTTEYSVSAPPPKPSSSSKTPAWSGDFNAKDLASGLRTILNKEKEG